MIETFLSKICAFHTRCARSTMPILCPRKTQSVQTRKSLPIPPYELRIFSFRKSFHVSANFSNCFVPLFSILSSSNFLKSLIYHRFDLVFNMKLLQIGLQTRRHRCTPQSQGIGAEGAGTLPNHVIFLVSSKPYDLGVHRRQNPMIWVCTGAFDAKTHDLGVNRCQNPMIWVCTDAFGAKTL